MPRPEFAAIHPYGGVASVRKCPLHGKRPSGCVTVSIKMMYMPFNLKEVAKGPEVLDLRKRPSDCSIKLMFNLTRRSRTIVRNCSLHGKGSTTVRKVTVRNEGGKSDDGRSMRKPPPPQSHHEAAMRQAMG
jgi:hypothetical protein